MRARILPNHLINNVYAILRQIINILPLYKGNIRFRIGPKIEPTVSQLADEVVEINGVRIVGYTNYPAMMATDASSFFARNLTSLFELLRREAERGDPTLFVNLEDDIIDASVLVDQGMLRVKR